MVVVLFVGVIVLCFFMVFVFSVEVDPIVQQLFWVKQGHALKQTL